MNTSFQSIGVSNENKTWSVEMSSSLMDCKNGKCNSTIHMTRAFQEENQMENYRPIKLN